MTLEDFFTLTEMKDGLTTPARVEDLVSMMQEEKDSIVKNVGEAARQWCTVASTLAATESKESLDHFIRLNGLYFLDLWLQEALKCSNDTSDSSLEELINGLLGALRKLPIDKETSVASGIEISVKNLFGHKSVRVQQTARALYDSWNEGRKNSSNLQNIEQGVGLLYSDVRPGDTTVTTAGPGDLEHPATDITSVGGIGGEDNDVINPKIIGSECAKGVKSPIASDQNLSHTKLNQVDEGRLQGDAKDASIMSSSCQASVPSMEESSSRTVERTNIEAKAYSPEVLNATTVSDKTRFSPDTLGKKENFIVSTAIGHDNSSCADHLNSQQHVPENPIVTDESMYLLKRKLPKGLDSDVSTQVYQTKSEGTDLAVLEHLSGNNMEHGVSDQDNAVCSNVCQDVYVNGCILRNSEDSEIPFHKEKAAANIADLDEESNLIMRDSTFASYISKPNDAKQSNLVNKKKLDVELDFVVDDALEVARQVAKEVEREVVDYREPLCSSSSEKKSEDRVMQPRSPDSVNGVQDLPPVGPKDEVLTDHNISGEPLSSDGDDSSRVSKSRDRTNDFICNQDSSHGPETAQVLDQNTQKNLCSFDLNEDVRSEEMDHSKVTMSSPITVAASKAAINQLAAPRSFGGEQGWKGSAATSAFRPASPRKIPDEKAVSAERSSNSSKQRQSFLNIDLNADGANNDGGNEPVAGKQIPASSGLPSGESSIEVSSKRAERLKLDLNRVSEDEDAPLSDCRMEGQALYHNQNGHHSPSPASSSSTRQPSMWNIDLNGSPCVFDSYDQRLSLGESSSKACGGRVKKDDPIISIMGARVAVNRRETAPQAGGAFVPNGQVECPTSANIARSGGGVGAHSALAYLTTPPGFLYNGLSMGPSTSISPIVYGSAMPSGPYRVDSVVPVVPHIMSSPVAAPQAAYTQSPFLVSMTSVPSGFNCIGSRLPGLDLNSSWGDSRDAERGSLRQLFMQAPGVLGEEMRSGSLPSSSDMRVKRKEPDGGWDSYPVVHKQQAPWH